MLLLPDLHPIFTRGVLALSLILFGLAPSPASDAQASITHAAARSNAPARNPVLLPLPPVLILDSEFQPQDWSVSAVVVGNATYTVTRQLTGGLGNSPFRFMSHRLPPVSGSGGNTIFVTHVFLAAGYDPSIQGAITTIDYRESGKIFSFPFPEAFSTTQPVVVQNGLIYRSSRFIRFVASNSNHDWENGNLTALTDADFIRVGGAENDHPDFSSSGGPILFGFTRINSRTSTQPPVPPNQDMVIDQGVDSWQIIIRRQSNPVENRPPQAVDDVFVVDGSSGIPVYATLDVAKNDSDPDQDSFYVTQVTQPIYGATGLFGGFIGYALNLSRFHDEFSYTISDRIPVPGEGGLTDTARVEIYVDCTCVSSCLSVSQVPASAFPSLQTTNTIDLPLIYRVRNQVLKPTPDGRRYVDMYYTSNPEILVNIMTNESLRAEAVATVELWQDNLRSLTDGDGSAVITQAQVDALESFLSNLSAASSAELRQLIADELARLGLLDDYVGLTMREAKRQAIGDPKLYLPLIIK